jgi:hypothetical protein
MEEHLNSSETFTSPLALTMFLFFNYACSSSDCVKSCVQIINISSKLLHLSRLSLYSNCIRRGQEDKLVSINAFTVLVRYKFFGISDGGLR